MNITKENANALTAQLKIELQEADYQAQVKKTLTDYQRKANIPGFRPGKVPFGMVQKMYGKSVLAEEVNKLLSEALHSYIEEQKMEILGQPIPLDDRNDQVDFDLAKDYTFYFEVGLAPEFTLALDKVSTTAYQVSVNDAMVQKSVDSILERYKEGDVVPELNADLFEKVYGKDTVKDEKEFRERIRQDGEKMYQREADRKFSQDATKAVVEATQMDLPDEFLKRWLYLSNREKNLTLEQIQSEYTMYRDMLKWQLIESRLLKENEVKVDRDDVKNYYIDNVISQYFPVPEDEEGRERLDQFAESMMRNQEEVKQVYDMIYDQKIAEILRASTKIKNTKIDFDDFVELLKKEHAAQAPQLEEEKSVKEGSKDLFGEEVVDDKAKKTRKPRAKKESNE